jgi:hypothetical protein
MSDKKLDAKDVRDDGDPTEIFDILEEVGEGLIFNLNLWLILLPRDIWQSREGCRSQRQSHCRNKGRVPNN